MGQMSETVDSPAEASPATVTITDEFARTVAAEASPTDGALASLLQKRLRFVAVAASLGLAFAVVQRQAFSDAASMTLLDRHVVVACLVAIGVVLPALVVLCVRPLRVNQLRWLEAAVFGGPIVQATGQTFAPMPPQAALPEMATAWPVAFVVQWFLILTVYGVFIPNTSRRAAVVVGVMASLALGSSVAAWSRYSLPLATWGQWTANVVLYLGLGSAFAVFNSARLESYRREAAAARELGQYRLGRRLGGGGMGEVFAAEHRLLKRPCAVKLIRPDRAADDTFVRRFEREAAAAARLTHPAAVQVYDYGRADDGTFYYVMEYLPGRTLDELVRVAGPLPPARAVLLLRQVCGALAEAHSLGLVHRDVKPGNVMVCDLGGRADAAKLLDFGLVVATDDADTRLTAAGGLLGTPAFMSPEQARGAADLTPASDLYSLGATAYFLLAGRPPFEAGNPLELLHAHLTRPVTPPSAHAPGLPADLEAVVLRLLAKEPGDRYRTAAEVADALAACEVS
jgi:serine/threonine-protein kinase